MQNLTLLQVNEIEKSQRDMKESIDKERNESEKKRRKRREEVSILKSGTE